MPTFLLDLEDGIFESLRQRYVCSSREFLFLYQPTVIELMTHSRLLQKSSDRFVSRRDGCFLQSRVCFTHDW